MQGHKSSVSSFPENQSCDPSSIPDCSQSQQPECRISSSNAIHIQCAHPLGERGFNVEWSRGESSSAPAERARDFNRNKTDHSWRSEDHQVEPSSIVRENAGDVQTGNGLFHCDLNMVSQYGESDNDECRIVERPNAYISTGSSVEEVRSNDNSFSSPSENEDISGSLLDNGHRLCKRRAIEVQAGSSSGSRYSNHSLLSTGIVPPVPTSLVMNNESRLVNPRLSFDAGMPASSSVFPLNQRTSSEGSRRNIRLRINNSVHRNPLSTEIEFGNSERLAVQSHLFDQNPVPNSDNRSLQQQTISLNAISSRQNGQSRWSGSSNFMNVSLPGSPEMDPMLYEESASRLHRRTLYESPLLSNYEIGRSLQPPMNWILNGQRSNNAENIDSTPPATSFVSNVNSNTSHRSFSRYPRRLSETARRSLLSYQSTEPGSRNRNHGVGPSSSAASVEMPILSEPGNFSRPIFGVPHSLRGLANASGEGRGSLIMSEIRHVLDIMRRGGESLRIEDLMALDHSILFGTTEIHDRHRDMRLDVDSMSYEELLALEELIGNVSTGLKEEAIATLLKQQKYSIGETCDEAELEPCSICREEYIDGEEMGILDCCHDFHRDCIKQWLVLKNLCPICKKPGLATSPVQ